MHTQAPAGGILKQDNSEETGESPNKKVRSEDEQMDVDSGQEMNANNRMLCQVERMLNSAESEDIGTLHEALKSLGHAGNKDVVSEIYSPPRVTPRLET